MAYYTEAEGEPLYEAVGALVDGWDGVATKRMFGCPSFTADGELFAVVSDAGLSLTRLPEAELTALAEAFTVEPFDAGGRTVAKWATIRPDPEAPASFEGFLRRSYEAAREVET